MELSDVAQGDSRVTARAHERLRNTSGNEDAGDVVHPITSRIRILSSGGIAGEDHKSFAVAVDLSEVIRRQGLRMVDSEQRRPEAAVRDQRIEPPSIQTN
ncbi:hypothetical protein ASD65_00145 [Microbacterium sp. Root61]|nr:hypothetical protein ASD65_00145 [Microbacterium sp. Root61]